ncbi:MAG: gephyrin-like molybdotransferase Glp [Corticimicrobacter sp.]|uniref:molybdopterin molybdotransferase MoeA n=1 Tax=Corticimicrobacter sp. TaxID=2678536 RepID=UPI0032D9B5F8
MLDFQEAQRRLSEAGPAPSRHEQQPLAELAGRILAQDIVARQDAPPADNSAMDGYALRLQDYVPGRILPVQERCYAGHQPAPLQPGQATRLFTGSLIPAGADTVMMQEYCRETEAGVEFLEAPVAGSHIRRQGEDSAVGSVLIEAGTVLNAAHIGLLASQGYTDAAVFPRVRIGILTTGDELVPPGQPRQPSQIYNSNGAMLAALAAGMNAEISHVLHAIDREDALTDAFRTLLRDSDLVLSVGGVSVGERDLVKPTLEKLGGSLELWKVKMKPGKPVALANVDGKPVIGLPGNPVSAFAVFTVLVTPLLRRMQGNATLFPVTGLYPLRANQPYNDSREEFLRVQYRPDEGGPALHPYAHQGSGMLRALPWASGLAQIPPASGTGDGAYVRYYDFAHWLQP